MIVAVDIDGVLAELHTEWIRIANETFGTSYDAAKVFTRWDIHHNTPEIGNKIYEVLEDPHLYDNVKVVEGAAEGVELLRKQGNSVVFVSAAPTGFFDAKSNWMLRNGFLDKSRRTHGDLYKANDKSLIRAQVLIDDGPKNIENFQGMSICFDAPYNQTIKKPRYYRMRGWKDLPRLWEEIYG